MSEQLRERREALQWHRGCVFLFGVVLGNTGMLVPVDPIPAAVAAFFGVLPALYMCNRTLQDYRRHGGDL